MGFILFQSRLLNTAHIITVAPPRPDHGKFVIEARVVGGVSYVEEYEDDEEAAGRYLALASTLLEDPSVAEGVRPPAPVDDPGVAAVTHLPPRRPQQPLL